MKRFASLLLFLVISMYVVAQTNGDSAHIRNKHIRTAFLALSDNTLEGLTLFYTPEGKLYLQRFVMLGNGYEPGTVNLLYFDIHGRDSSFLYAYIQDSALGRTTGPFEYPLEHRTYSYPSDSVTLMHDTVWTISGQMTLIRRSEIAERYVKNPIPHGRQPVCLPENMVAYHHERTLSTSFRYANMNSRVPLDSSKQLDVTVFTTTIANNKIVRHTDERNYYPTWTKFTSTNKFFTLNKRHDTITEWVTSLVLGPYDSLTPPNDPSNVSRFGTDHSMRVTMVYTRKYLWWYSIRYSWIEMNDERNMHTTTRDPQGDLPFVLWAGYPQTTGERKKWHTVEDYKAIYGARELVFTYW